MKQLYKLVAKTTEHKAAAIAYQQNTLNSKPFRGHNAGELRLMEVTFDGDSADLTLIFQHDSEEQTIEGHHLFARTDFGTFPVGDLVQVEPKEQQ